MQDNKMQDNTMQDNTLQVNLDWKIWTVVKLSGKWEMIQRNPDATQVFAPLQFAMTRLWHSQMYLIHDFGLKRLK